eukprot:g2286.t1
MATGFSVFGVPIFCEVSPTPTAISGHLSETDLRPTEPSDLIPLLAELGLTPSDFQFRVLRFREWFSTAIVTSILQNTHSAYLNTDIYRQLFHESNSPIYPMDFLLTPEQERLQIEWIRTKRKTLDEQLATNPGQSYEERLQYRTALCSLESMLWLMSGSWIPGLLPDGCPTGYICDRLRYLRDGGMLNGFRGFQVLPESIQELEDRLPSDSVILTFLMCIYLKAPGMNFDLFHQEAPRVRNGPLVFMNVAPFSDPAYSAILTAVPTMREMESHAFILRDRIWDGNVHEAICTVMFNGSLRANFGGSNGFFEAMTIYLLYHKVKFGNIGGVSFDLMQDMDWVLGEKDTPALPWLIR